MKPNILKWLKDNGWNKSRGISHHWTRSGDGAGIQREDHGCNWHAFKPDGSPALGPFTNAKEAAQAL